MLTSSSSPSISARSPLARTSSSHNNSTAASAGASRPRSPYSTAASPRTAAPSSASSFAIPQSPTGSRSSAQTTYSHSNNPRATTPVATRPAPPPSSQPPSVYYADRGTQYSPKGLPPTAGSTFRQDQQPQFKNPFAASSRSTIPAHHLQSGTTQPQPPSSSSTISTSTGPSASALSKLAVSDAQPEPSEPRVRVTPQSSLQNVSASSGSSTTTTRRHHSSISDSVADSSVAPTDPSGKVTPSSAAHKRSKTSASPNTKAMPVDYSKCDSKELAFLISDMLMELIHFNDEIPLRDGHLTRFHSRAPPGISVRDYLQRLTFHATLPPPILLAMVYYIDMLCERYPQFTINSLTVHRFLITAATVASKGLSDSFWTNNTYARVGGVSIKELALLELELLSRMDWHIVPQPHHLEQYYKSLVERSPDHRLEDEPMAVDAASEVSGGGNTTSSVLSTSEDAQMSVSS